MTAKTDRICRHKFYIVTVLVVLFIYHLSLNQSVMEITSLFSRRVILDIKYVQENLEFLDQTDPQLIEYFKARHLTPPSKLPFSLAKGKGYYKDSTIDWVQNFFGDKRNGIFIEAGANDGVTETHTLFLERERGWSGLLIECNPSTFAYARSLHRNAWMAQACLSVTPNAGFLNFSVPSDPGVTSVATMLRRPKGSTLPGYPKQWKYFEVETVPLYTLLAAAGFKEIDYFSFDIEGGELAVLKTFPFNEFIFKVITIETFYYEEDEIKELDGLVQSNGYHFVKAVGPYKDFIYVHNSVKHLID